MCVLLKRHAEMLEKKTQKRVSGEIDSDLFDELEKVGENDIFFYTVHDFSGTLYIIYNKMFDKFLWCSNNEFTRILPTGKRTLLLQKKQCFQTYILYTRNNLKFNFIALRELHIFHSKDL